MKKLLFRYDSRDKIFQQKFGQVLEFPKEINFDSSFQDEIQPMGDVKCVAFTTCDIAEDQQGIEFDITSINDLWQRVPSVAQGSDPRDVLGEAVKNGLLPKGKTERTKVWRSYWRADIGNQDAFDNVRSTMLTIKCPVGAGTYWYREWHGAEMLPIGKNPQNGHMYDIQGWKEIDGKPYFIIEAWLGRKVYMSREVFNQALKPYGMQTWVLSTSLIDEKRKKTLIEVIKDLMINLIITLRNLIEEQEATISTPPPNSPPEPEIAQPKPSLLVPWAKAIETFENVHKSLNNPGAIKGLNGKFLTFPTYQKGFDYLCDYLKRAATGKHKAYRPEMTLLEFQKVYAPITDKNNPDQYAKFVADRLGVSTQVEIKNLV